MLGLGRMGAAIAERLIDAGHDLRVYNRTRAKADAIAALGAQIVDEPVELLRFTDVCLTVVTDDTALEEVVLGPTGILAGARSETALVDMSTVSVDVSARVAAAADARAVDSLRAPASGNPSVVRAGTLAMIISGPRSRFDSLRSLLEAIGPQLYYVGSDEQARVVKLALNLMVAGTAALMSEALVLGERGGVDLATLLEVMAGSAVGSPFVKYKTKPLLSGDYSATFTTDMMRKDLALIRAQADASGTAVQLASRLQRLYDELSAAGYADADLMAQLPLLRDASELHERRAAPPALAPEGVNDG